MFNSPSVLVGQPLDTIKTRAQVSFIRRPGFRQTLISVFQTAPAGAFEGPMDIAVQTIKKEGFLALYKGESVPHVVCVRWLTSTQ